MIKRAVSILLATLFFMTSSNLTYGYTGVSSWFTTEVREADMAWELVPKSLQDADLTVNVTRGEFADIISAAYFSVHYDYPFEFVVVNFADTDSRTANAALQLGVVSGFPDNTFRENSVITRQEMFVMIQRFMLIHSMEYDLDSRKTDRLLSPFNDADLISDWAKSAVAAVIGKEIVKGTGNQTINPLAPTSRAEALILAKRMLIILSGEHPETLQKRNATLSETRHAESNLSSTGYNPLYARGYNNDKYQLIFGSNGDIVYSSDSEARQFLEKTEVNVWLVDSEGNKYPGKKTLLVNIAITSMVQSIFETIFNGKEKFPIKDVSGYSWRSNSTSEHCYGIAIDINPVENYMIRSDGSILAGSLWDPTNNIYSISEHGEVVNAFKQFGFSWGGNAWSSSKDYMHFSYLGR